VKSAWLASGEVGHTPVQAAGVVTPESQAGLADGFGDLADKVTSRAAMDRVARARAWRIPQRHPIVVLGGWNHVAGASLDEQPGPCCRVEVRRGPLV
jgi:hypothetical protein